MLTNNFYNAFADGLCETDMNKSKIKNTQGTSDISSYSYFQKPFKGGGKEYPASRIQTDGSGSGSVGLIVGSDGTPATVDDYKLGNQITTGFDCQLSYPSLYYNPATIKKYVLTLTLTNNSSDDLTIREMGYVRSDGTYAVLFDRIVFDTPVVIKPGATKTFEYRLNMPQP